MDIKIKYTLKRITEDGLIKPVTKKFNEHKMPLDECFDTGEEAMHYLSKELGHVSETEFCWEDIFVLPVVVPDLGDN